MITANLIYYELIFNLIDLTKIALLDNELFLPKDVCIFKIKKKYLKKKI